MKYIYIIYSCQKNAQKAEFLYNKINGLINNGKCFIIYGNENLIADYEIRDDKYIVLKCGDFYENLPTKTVFLCKAVKHFFPLVKGMIKCDDDIIPNIAKINELLMFIDYQEIDYLGKMIPLGKKNKNITAHTSNEHFNKCSDIKYNVLKKVVNLDYAGGPLYYLSAKAIAILAEIMNISDDYIFEDNFVGAVLGFSDRNYLTYSNNIADLSNCCVQNINGKHSV